LAPEKFAVLGLDEVVQLDEIPWNLVQTLQESLDGDVHHLGVELQDVIKFLAVDGKSLLWVFLLLELLFRRVQRSSPISLLTGFFLLLLFFLFGIIETDFQFITLKVKISLNSLTLNPLHDLLHLSLTNLRKVVGVSGLEAFGCAVGAFLGCNFFETFAGDGGIRGKFEEKFEVFLEIIALLFEGDFDRLLGGKDLDKVVHIGHVCSLFDTGRFFLEGGAALFGEIVVEGADDLVERPGEVLDFQSFWHEWAK
jgi:hypothetical protein